MPWIGAAIAAGGSLIGGLISSDAQSQASNASQQGAQAAVNEQARQFNVTTARQQPWLTTGTSALNRIAQIYGLDTYVPNQPGSAGAASNDAATLAQIRSGAQAWEAAIPGNGQGIIQLIDSGASLPQVQAAMQSLRTTTTNPANTAFLDPLITQAAGASQTGGVQGGTFVPGTGGTATTGGGAGLQTPDFSSFYASPDYQYRRQQSLDALKAQASTGIFGGIDSGAHEKAILDRAGNLASGEFNNYVNRLSALSGVGQTTSQNLASLGQNYATNVGQSLQNAADTRASAYANQGRTWANTISQIGGYAGQALPGLFSGGGGQFATYNPSTGAYVPGPQGFDPRGFA